MADDNYGEMYEICRQVVDGYVDESILGIIQDRMGDGNYQDLCVEDPDGEESSKWVYDIFGEGMSGVDLTRVFDVLSRRTDVVDERVEDGVLNYESKIDILSLLRPVEDLDREAPASEDEEAFGD